MNPYQSPQAECSDSPTNWHSNPVVVLAIVAASVATLPISLLVFLAGDLRGMYSCYRDEIISARGPCSFAVLAVSGYVAMTAAWFAVVAAVWYGVMP